MSSRPARPGRQLPFGVAAVGFACVGILAIAFGPPGCDEGAGFASDSDPALSTRAERYGIFRDLVYFPGRPGDSSAGFFLDLFETSQADWRVYREGREPAAQTRDFLLRFTPGAVLDGSLPVVGIDLEEARAYARWRFGRLPHYEEWDHAARAGGVYRYPWGDLPRAAYANAGELGSGRLSPVGMFESGRQRGRPFDLLGNASEWTETVLYPWSGANSDVENWPADLAHRRRLVAGSHLFRPAWPFRLGSVIPLPAAALIAVDDDLPRLLTGGATRPVDERRRDSAFPEVDSMRPNERGSFVGMRVATDPHCLLRALAAESDAPSPSGERHLRGFLDRNREVLRPVWLERAAEFERVGSDGGSSLARLLDEVFDRGR